MLLRLLKNSFLKRPKAVSLVLLFITMGTTVATAFLGKWQSVPRVQVSALTVPMDDFGRRIRLDPFITGRFSLSCRVFAGKELVFSGIVPMGGEVTGDGLASASGKP